MHRFQRWRDILQAAPDEEAVGRAMRDYVAVLPPAVISLLPEDCQRALCDLDIQGAAVTLLHCELGFTGDSATAELLHEIAHTFAAASTRITRLGREPLMPTAE
jgi:hypothetical protein